MKKILTEILEDKWNVGELWSDFEEYWGNKYTEGNEHYDNGIIIAPIQNKESNEEKFLILFSGASVRESDVSLCIISDNDKDYRSEWEANRSLYTSIGSEESKENTNLAEEVLNNLHELDNFAFSELPDVARSLKISQDDYVYVNIDKDAKEIRDYDLEKLIEATKIVEKILGKEKIYITKDIWKNQDTGEEIGVDSSYYSESGTPIDENGDDMEFVGTKVTEKYVDIKSNSNPIESLINDDIEVEESLVINPK